MHFPKNLFCLIILILIWQQLNCDISEQWDIGGYLLNTHNTPLSGASAAIVNVEWHYANSEMIDYETFSAMIC